MALSNLILILLITISSSTFTGHCREQKANDVSRMLPCMELLMRCQNHISSPNPPPSCCVPLKRIIFRDPQCLCSISTNGDFLAYLNVTSEDAGSLPGRCHLPLPDVSKCSFDDVPTIKFGRKATKPAGNRATSHAGPLKYRVGSRNCLKNVIVSLLVSKVLFSEHVM